MRLARRYSGSSPGATTSQADVIIGFCNHMNIFEFMDSNPGLTLAILIVIVFGFANIASSLRRRKP